MSDVEFEKGFERDVIDLGAGLGLLVPEFSERLLLAMARAEIDMHDAEELIHVTALALARLSAEGKADRWMLDQWDRCSREFHECWCNECTICGTWECPRP